MNNKMEKIIKFKDFKITYEKFNNWQEIVVSLIRLILTALVVWAIFNYSGLFPGGISYSRALTIQLIVQVAYKILFTSEVKIEKIDKENKE